MRPHFRGPVETRPGGELSIDVAGPLCPGRWPSDLSSDRWKVARYFLLGALQLFSKDQMKEREHVQKEACEDAGCDESVLPAVVGEAEGNRVRYYVVPLETKRSEEVLDAVKRMVTDINCEWKGKVVYRLHGDRAFEVTGDLIKKWCLSEGIRVTHTAGY